MIRECRACGQKNRVPGRQVAATGKCGRCHAPLPPPSEPIEADAALFDDVVANAQVPVLVDFWAPWCGPCHMVAPDVKRLAAEVAGQAAVLKVDTQQSPALAARYGIRSIPSFYVFHRGNVVASEVGVQSRDKLRALIARAAA